MNNLIEATLDRLLDRIENGDGNWIKEWTGGGSPRNATTKKRYRGVNILLLWAARQSAGYTTNEWASYKQWQSVGKQVAEGQKSTVIFIVKPAVKKGGNINNPDDIYNLFKCSVVFNRAQLTEPDIEVRPEPPLEERHAHCATTIAATRARFVEHEDAAYMVTDDAIRMPPLRLFKDADSFYGTAFHELIHWTGAKHRLDRGMGSAHTSRYAEEELIAEFGAAFLCAEHGITDTNENSAAYIRDWLRSIKTDRGQALLTAASEASKAAEFILPPIISREEQAA